MCLVRLKNRIPRDPMYARADYTYLQLVFDVATCVKTNQEAVNNHYHYKDTSVLLQNTPLS